MTSIHLLDRQIAGEWPDLSTPEALQRFESTPFEARIAASSTWEAVRLGAAVNPQAPAIRFLPNADPEETPLDISHAQFIARCTQAANAFHALGVGPGDVVSFLLPLLPQAFCTLYGAQAVGVANPVNPLLETQHLAGILRAAGTRVLVALGPVPGSDIWNKVLQLQAQLPGLRAILAVGGHGVATATPHDAFSGAANSEGAAPILDFDALLDTQPLDAVRASNVIAPSDTAAYFHTGGTTG
ncbi:MAG: AMP-binding protein, partial [Gammaproteobacteria bacterium]